MVLSRRGILGRFVSIPLVGIVAALLPRKVRAETKADGLLVSQVVKIKKEAENDLLNQLLDEGGQLVIRKEKDKMLVVTEYVDVNGQLYHGGLVIKSLEELKERWHGIVEGALRAIKRKKVELSLQKEN